MRLKYSVSNFRSIGHNIEFSMLPLEDIQDDRFLTEIETVAGTWKVLKRGVLFGPNASGKTSFIDSIWYAVNYITKGPQNGFMKKVNQFRGNIPDLEGVTTFQFLIYADKNVYQYGFSLDKTQVFEEWLHILSGKEFSPLFERITNKDKKTEITIFPKYGRINSKERALAEILKESIKEKQANQLFLYKLAENGSIKVDPVFSWFKSIQVIYPSSKIHALPLRIQTDKDFREFLSIKLHSLDTGVNQVSVATNKMELSELIDKFELPDEIVHDIEEIQNGILNLNGKYFIFSEGQKNNITFIQVKFEHTLNGEKVKFNMEDESDGTKRMIDLLPMLINFGADPNAIYFIDELDRSLHTKLSKYLVNEFVRKNENGQFITLNNQFVFTAHDVSLINLDTLRPEEIWFIEKNNNGETKLKPFSDFNVNDNQDILKDYLSGRFGAIPMIKGGI